MTDYPENYRWITSRFGKVIKAHRKPGEEVLAAGPLKKRQAHLVQLAAAAATRSEGAVHSHVRRALEAGAKPEEIYHALVLLVSTIGFPAASAALSWARETIEKKALQLDGRVSRRTLLKAGLNMGRTSEYTLFFHHRGTEGGGREKAEVGRRK